MTSLSPLSAFSSLSLPLLPTLSPPPFLIPLIPLLPSPPHPPSRYSRTIDQMASCLFYMSLWKISSAVDSETFAKNRHRPTLAECWGKGRGVWRGLAFPTSCTETSSVCTPRRAFGKQPVKEPGEERSPLHTRRNTITSRDSLASFCSQPRSSQTNGNVGKAGQ